MAKKKRTEDAFRAGIIEDRRPWGMFRRYPHEEAGSIKIITVDPGGILSLQYHDGRDEYWVVLDRGLEVTVGDRTSPPPPTTKSSSPEGPPTASGTPDGHRPGSWRSGSAGRESPISSG